ncbi:MAG: PilZ domain-containing protein [Gaiellales bacterium]
MDRTRNLVRIRSHGRDLFSRLLETHGDTVVLAPPWDEDGTCEVPAGSRLSVGLLVPGGVEWREAIVLGPAADGCSLTVELTGPMVGPERRRDPRTRTDFPVEVFPALGGPPIRGTVIDVSVSGVRVRLPCALACGDAVSMVVELPGEAPVELTARVARQADDGELGFVLELIPSEPRHRLVRSAFARRLDRAA